MRRLLPTLDWTEGALGVRLRFEPKDIEALYKDYLVQRKSAVDTKSAGTAARGAGRAYTLKLWPENMRDYLDRRLGTQFTVRAYLLDEGACVTPTNGIAQPQPLPQGIGPLDGNPLSELIRVKAIAAQRGLGEPSAADPDPDSEPVSVERKPLSEQLRSYYMKHLDPTEAPEAADLEALEAIEQSQLPLTASALLAKHEHVAGREGDDDFLRLVPEHGIGVASAAPHGKIQIGHEEKVGAAAHRRSR